MKPQPVLVPAEALTELARGLLMAGGMSGENAGIVAEVLVWADLRGVGSHGVSRLPRYLEMIAEGDMNPSPHLRYASDGGAIAILDADRAAGPIAMNLAMTDVVRKARSHGAAMTLVRATTHTAALGFYTRKAAEAGALAIAAASSGPNMAYHGARRAAVSTSPLSIAAPGGDGTPIVFDMGTGIVSLGRLAQMARNGEPIPAGYALDREGNPTTDPARASIPMPMAGAKGSGLALMIEILTSLLVANPILADALDGTDKRHRQNAFVLAIDIGRLCDLEQFTKEVRRLETILKGLPRASEDTPVLLPGERGDAVYKRQIAQGIALSPRTMKDLQALAAKYNVDMGSFAAGDM